MASLPVVTPGSFMKVTTDCEQVLVSAWRQLPVFEADQSSLLLTAQDTMACSRVWLLEGEKFVVAVGLFLVLARDTSSFGGRAHRWRAVGSCPQGHYSQNKVLAS